MENQDKKKESPYVHRYEAYIHDLKHNWAYVDTKRIPGKRFKKEKENTLEFPTYFLQKGQK